MKKRICFILSMLLLVGALVGCAEKLPEEALQSQSCYENRVKGIQGDQMVCWDNYIVSDYGRGSIYNRSSGELQKTFCEDPECDGDCFLEQGPATIYHVADGKIYFVIREKHNTHYCYKEIVSGAVHVFFTLDAKEVISTRDMYMDNGNLYYPKKCLVEGGDPNDANDYHLYLYRMTADGKNNEMVYKMRDNTEYLWFVDNGILYTQWQMKFYQIDLTTMESRQFFDLLAAGFLGAGQVQYINGKLYFSYSAEAWMMAAPNGQPFAQPRIVTVDVETGEWNYLLDVSTSSYCITNEAIYFVPAEITQRSDPDVYAPSDEQTKYCSCPSVLYACDLDGGNIRLAWKENERHICLLNYTVVEDTLYTLTSEFDQQSNRYGDTSFAEIHLDTGKILPAVVVD